MGRRITDEEIYKIVNDAGYILNKIFSTGKRRMINVTCPDGHTYDKRLDGFKSGERCKECQKVSYEEVKRRFAEEGVELLSREYVNSKEKLHVLFACGHDGHISLINFMGGKRCGICAGNRKHTYEYIKETIELEGHKLISDTYINEATKLSLQCPNGHIYEAPYGSFRQGHRCPYCKKYKGEEKVKETLDSLGVTYIRQHKIDGCIYKKLLSFDFYIPSLNVCIEYDGIQHFEPRAFSSVKSEEDISNEFEEVKLRDSIKNTYCKNNNIQLIRIPYFKFNNIKEILKEELNIA